MKIKCPKISNPKEFVEIFCEDKGNIVPLYDNLGIKHEGYTTYFEFDGEKFYSLVAKDSLDPANVANERFYADCKFLAQFDLDLHSADIRLK